MSDTIIKRSWIDDIRHFDGDQAESVYANAMRVWVSTGDVVIDFFHAEPSLALDDKRTVRHIHRVVLPHIVAKEGSEVLASGIAALEAKLGIKIPADKKNELDSEGDIVKYHPEYHDIIAKRDDRLEVSEHNFYAYMKRLEELEREKLNLKNRQQEIRDEAEREIEALREKHKPEGKAE
jgi:hypothetical protein